jgi:hypothetical protein
MRASISIDFDVSAAGQGEFDFRGRAIFHCFFVGLENYFLKLRGIFEVLA